MAASTAAISKLMERGQLANPVTLKNLFEQDDALQEVGGAQYLSRLAASVVTIINAEDYGRTIHDLFLRRQLITIGEDVVNEAYQHDLDRLAVRQIEQAEKKLFDLAEKGQAEGGFRPFASPLANAIIAGRVRVQARRQDQRRLDRLSGSRQAPGRTKHLGPEHPRVPPFDG